MSRLAMKSFAVGIACLCLTACVTRREFVLAPEARGIVLDAETGAPVGGAEVRFLGVDGIAAVKTGADGRFALEGRTEKRTIVAMPVSGVFRDSTRVRATARGRAEAFASASYIQRGLPALALYRVTVLMFPADTKETPLHELMQDCVEAPAQHHALHLSGFVAGIDPANPPDWLEIDTAFELDEHLQLTLPSSGFMACAQMNAAYELFRAQQEPLRELQKQMQPQPVP